eukprot:400272_1
MAIDYCNFENKFGAAYTEIAISVIIFMILQLLLCYNTCYYEFQGYRRENQFKQTRLSIRITFVALQLCGFYFTFIDLIRFVIDPYVKFAQQSNFMCALIAYSPKVISIVYFAIYLCQVLFRLEASFRGSFLAISKRYFLSLAVFILIPSIIVPSSFLILVDKPCIWKWDPIDIQTNNEFGFCDLHTEGMANAIIGIGIIWIVITNIIYGFIFGSKLYKVLRSKRSNDDITGSFRLKSLIIKNTILTTTVTISTLVNWFMWLYFSSVIGVGICFLYFDMWFNCLVIGLMFSHNDKYYKKLCKPCIICCFMDCDRTFDKNNKSENEAQLKRTNKYLLRSHSRMDMSSNTSSGNTSVLSTQTTTQITQCDSNGNNIVDSMIHLTTKSATNVVINHTEMT